MLPLEVAGWWLRRLSVKAGDWVLVGGTDSTAMLSVHLSCRFPAGVNIVSGLLTATNSAVLPNHSTFPPVICCVLSEHFKQLDKVALVKFADVDSALP